MTTGEQLEVPMVGETLSESERSLWFAWKRAHEVIKARVAEDVRAATGLSDADVAILVQVADAEGPMRQSALVSRLGWDRTRLSHQLSRMESRGLVARRKTGGGVEIELSADGRSVVSRVQPIHAAAVRQHLIEPFSRDEIEHLRDALGRIATIA